jgi:hypothetical protein
VVESTFQLPRDFAEFYSRFPRFVGDFVRRRMMNRSREDQEDRESELLHFLMTLPDTSKFRSPGTNGYETGCLDRIMTFNPARCGGASPGQFLSYVSRILLNRFISLEGEQRSNPVCRRDTLRLSNDLDEYNGVSDSKMVPSQQCLLELPAGRGLERTSEVWSHTVVQGFVAFIKRHNPELVSVLFTLSICGKLCDAKVESGMNERAFGRARSRLRTLYHCFRSGSQPPKQRRIYRDRVPRIVGLNG